MEKRTETKTLRSIFCRAAVSILVVCTLLLAGYIMVNHLGLAEELDFGAGAYYYADIPGFQNYVNGSHYISETPMWILIVLFLIWGAAMYRLWTWLNEVL